MIWNLGEHMDLVWYVISDAFDFLRGKSTCVINVSYDIITSACSSNSP